MTSDNPQMETKETGSRPLRRRKTRKRSSLHSYGEPMIWLTGGSLALALFMILGLLLLVLYQGARTFWPGDLLRLETMNGDFLLGEVVREEDFVLEETARAQLTPQEAAAARETGGNLIRRLVRIGNFEITGEHFRWVDDFKVKEESRPEWAVLVERLTWGRFYGIPKAFLVDGKKVASSPGEVWARFEEHHDPIRSRLRSKKDLETRDIGRINHTLETARLDLRKVEMSAGRDSQEWRAAREEYDKKVAETETSFAVIRKEIADLERENSRFAVVFDTCEGNRTVEATLKVADIVRAFPANSLSFIRKVEIYLDRWWEFLFDDPREANSEGGVWPAIFGTVIMTLIMCLFVVPFGVLAALYLREYAKAGFIVSAVRIAINNLAGVPSIVFGVFGLGFFCYIIGASLDEILFSARLPNPTYGKGGMLWASLTLALLTLPVVIVATEEALSAVPGSMREGSYACGASKWQTIQRIVLPRALPGIMTGMILAMARGAGEVAPLMLVGAVKMAPDLALDGIFPYLHPERSFMHLGFHIYDLGFQSQNSEAAKPMVFTTTLLLIAIIAGLNIAAIRLRARLRRKFVSGQF